MATSITDPLVGHTVDGRYHVIRRLARGGMATVYVAVDRRLDREVALKVMHPHLAEGAHGATFENRFRREARAAAKLTHPGLVSVHDQGVDGEVSYLVMELVDGENLRTRLHRRPPLTVVEALEITIDVLEALASVHSAGLVHRDIKPENVLLTADGRVKVADFGLARAVTELTMATTGSVLGTVSYLAPELLAHGTSDPRSDVYAVGVTLFEMLTGRSMFTGNTPIQVAVQQLNDSPPRPSDLQSWVPTQVDDLVGLMTARDAQARLGDAGAALAAVRELRWSLSSLVLEHPVATPAVSEPSLSAELFDDQSDLADATDTLNSDAEILEESPHEDDTNSAMTSTQSLHLQPTVSHPTAATAAVTPIKHRNPRRRRIAVIASVLLLLVMAATGGVLWYFMTGPGAYTQVPTTLVNATEVSAVTAVEDAELTPVVTSEYSDTVAEGRVIRTDPAAGEQVRKDSHVSLVLSRGVEHFTVPTGLIGERRKNVVAAIEEAGFSVGVISREYYDDKAKGIVTEISATEGSEQPHTTSIDLTVSQGKAPVTIPNLTEMTLDEAKDQLEELGLVLEQGEPRHSDDVEVDLVVAQSPKPLADGHRTDTVTVHLSLGPELVEVPNVVRMSTAEATERLTSLGFKVDKQVLLGGFLDIVQSQSVQRGTELPKGSTITISIV